MHSKLRRAAVVVLAVLQLEACFRYRKPSEDYTITTTVSGDDGGIVSFVMP